MKSIRNLGRKAVAGASLALVSVASMAQGAPTPDTSGITTAATTVGTVGAAVFLVYVGIKVFKWARNSL